MVLFVNCFVDLREESDALRDLPQVFQFLIFTIRDCSPSIRVLVSR